MNNKKQYILDAIKIYELDYTLENCAASDNKNIEDYTLEEVLNEAKYVLSTFYEGGHMNNEDLNSDEDKVRTEAEKQVRQLELFIRKYDNNVKLKKRKSRSLTEEQKSFFSNLKQGDKILLNDGDIAEFVKLNRVRFVGMINGEEYNIPVSMVVKKI